MKRAAEFKRLRYVRVYLYSSYFISALLILGSAASAFGYKAFAPGFGFVGLLGGLIGLQISSALLMLVQDLEEKPLKGASNYKMNLIIGVAVALSIGALLIWIFIVQGWYLRAPL